MRTFRSGATRDSDSDKPDYEQYESPLVEEIFGRYMLAHNGPGQAHRSADNWQKGIPFAEYLKSAMRHFLDVRKLHDGFEVLDRRTGKPITLEDACCALRFNINGMLYELARPQNKRKRRKK